MTRTVGVRHDTADPMRRLGATRAVLIMERPIPVPGRGTNLRSRDARRRESVATEE
jgi:hypothetical protein